MADAAQFEKVRSIVTSDESRRVVVVSAAGKRYKDDHKVTDLLYLCYAHLQYGVSCDGIYQMICDRYLSIRDELGLRTDLEGEFAALRRKMDQGISQDELVSRGEYFAAKLMADYLGFDFLDSTMWLKFRLDGSVDQEASYEALQHALCRLPDTLRLAHHPAPAQGARHPLTLAGGCAPGKAVGQNGKHHAIVPQQMAGIPPKLRVQLPPHASEILEVDIIITDGQLRKIGFHSTLHRGHRSFPPQAAQVMVIR